MEWLELTVKTHSDGVDIVAERLTILGYDSFIIDDEQDFEQFLEQNHQYWDYVDEELADKMKGVSQIRLYIACRPDAAEIVAALREQLSILKSQHPDENLGTLEVTLKEVKDEDWENSWKQYYQPISVGKQLIVVPQWLNPENPEERIPVILDPGMIFGTGAHASTQMCMRALEAASCPGKEVIDLGSGSGILSITALRLGAKHAIGVDIDPKAEDIARENAAMNGLDSTVFSAVTGDVICDIKRMSELAGTGYDIVLANIVADVIIPLSAVIPNFMRKNGLFICSGILDVRLQEVLGAIQSHGMKILSVEHQEDWCCITAASASREA